VIALLGMEVGGSAHRRQHGAHPICHSSTSCIVPADLHVPSLLMHSSDDDGFIPSTASLALAARVPTSLPTRFTVAGHTKLWNFGRVRWNDAIAHWLATAPL
jgi:hypothetical protein